MNYKLQTKKPHTAILIKLISLASIGAVIFTPGIPLIVKFFEISERSAQSVLTLFLVGYALSPIVYGPLANHFGRKPVIYLGLVVAIVGSLLSAFSDPLHSYFLLLAARLLTALGSGVGLILSLTIINDYYYEHQARKVVPLVSSAFAFVPFLGVAIGGVFVHHFGWASSFYFLMGYYIIVLLLATRLPETGANLNQEKMRFKTVMLQYKKAVRDHRLMTFSILFGTTTGMIYIFAASAPIIAIDTLKLSPQEYGFINLIIAVFFLSGNSFASLFSKRISALKMISLGCGIFGGSFIVLFSCFMLGYINAYTFFIPCIIAYFGFPIAFTNAIVLASSHFKDRATGSAVTNCINVLIPILGVLLLQNIPGPTALTMPSLMLGFSVVYLLLFIYSKRYAR